MLTIRKLINEGLINKSKLILKRGEYLNIEKNQILFLSKIFENDNFDFFNLKLDDISKNLVLEKKEIFKYLKKLITEGLIEFKQDGDKFYFNFNFLINKLIETYLPPNDSASFEMKYFWMKNNVDLKFANKHEKELKEIINNNNWNHLLIVFEEIIDMENVNWPLFISLIDSKTIKNSTKKDDYNKILKINWLVSKN